MRLAAFIRANTESIVGEWSAFAKTLKPVADHMSPLALRDHVTEILTFIANDIETHQTMFEQTEKSKGKKRHAKVRTAAEIHASLRHAGGFDMDQMVSEYRALRASVVKLWSVNITQPTPNDLSDLTRFHEAIDQVLTESISDYSKRLEHSRNMFLGILSHDLRSPLSAAHMSAELTLKMGVANLNPRQIMLISQVSDCMDRAMEMINYLLDITRARLGSGIPIIKEQMDMGFVSRQLVDEMRTKFPKRVFNLSISGDTQGKWDRPRIGQVFSNLLGNAVQYGFSDSEITLVIRGESDQLVLSVHNDGVPIPEAAIGRIFESLTRSHSTVPFSDAEALDLENPGEINLGLGLYITKEILAAHGGTIGVTSTEAQGTTFTAIFPRSV